MSNVRVFHGKNKMVNDNASGNSWSSVRLPIIGILLKGSTQNKTPLYR